ncbi:hypothetical protein AB0O64_34770 [Streptomyces sp. NPDC088341]|uniref:hypothetical protein n=1 Tax=Streptomyces sp. NPDC088341 TaxID=3154870 RepID=UPI0034476D78
MWWSAGTRPDLGADPLHFALVFGLSHTTASRYAAIAQNLLDGQIEQTADDEDS